MAADPQHTHPMAGVDAFSPREIARLVETRGVAKANAPNVTTLVLGILAGAFIALGAVLSTIISTDSSLGYGLTRWAAGLGFSLGLVLVVVAGAELFTGNNLVLMSWVSRRITLAHLIHNWGIVYVGNLIGALSVVLMVYLSEWWKLDGGVVGGVALATAAVKAGLPFWVAFVRGILANALVCLAVWLATAGRSVLDKVIAIALPISAFVAAGFEHSVANMYFIPEGLFLKGQASAKAASALTQAQLSQLNMAGFLRNLAAATLGNIVGGGVLVGLVYWFVYLREPAPNATPGAR